MIKLALFDLDGTLYDADPLSKNGGDFSQIVPFPGVHKTLRDMSVPKAIITRGDPTRQYAKIEKLGLTDLVNYINVCSCPENKLESFSRAIELFKLRHLKKHVLVVGNRIDEEIRYGNMIGCRTVHLKKGKYQDLEPATQYDEAEYTITEFEELLDLIKRIR